LVLALIIVLVVAAAGIYVGAINGFIIFGPQGSNGGSGQTNQSGLVIGTPVSNQPDTGTGQISASGSSGTQPANGTSNQQNQTTNRTTTTTGGSGGGSGGGGSSSCTPSWDCTAWSTCSVQGSQERTCTDTACGSASRTETQNCQYTPPEQPSDCNGVCLMPSTMSISRSQNQTFNVYVYINTTESVYAAQFDLYYDKAKVNVTNVTKDVTEGDFLKQDGADTFTTQPTNDYTNGKLKNYADTRIGTPSGVSGSGILANIVFNADATGIASLMLDNVIIVDQNVQALNIPVSGTSTINIAA